MKGGSGVTMLSESEFYFAAGGNSLNQVLYLQKGSKQGIQNIFNFSASVGVNDKWWLRSYSIGTVTYHSLTYAPSTQTPTHLKSVLISNANGAYAEVVHFEM